MEVRAQNLLTNLDSRCNRQHHGEGAPIWLCNNSKSLHFDNKHDTCTSSENYEESNYGHDLDVLITLHSLHVSYPTWEVGAERKLSFKTCFILEVLIKAPTSCIVSKIQEARVAFTAICTSRSPHQQKYLLSVLDRVSIGRAYVFK